MKNYDFINYYGVMKKLEIKKINRLVKITKTTT